MVSYDIRDLQERLLGILLMVDKVCREHQLCYYLAAGTMLGAVRHKGFIPWDDDIDIAMPRKDYDLLMQHGKEWIPQPLELLCAENNPGYPFGFAKVVDGSTTLVEREHHSYVGGLYVDVFPIDEMTANAFLQKTYCIRYSFYKKMNYLLCRNPYKHGTGPSSWLPRICRHLFTVPKMMGKQLRLQRKYSNKERMLVVDHDFGKKGIVRKEVYGTPTEILFEGHRLFGVERPHEYLAHLYGDYMKIPSEDKRKQHGFYYIDYTLPYRDYQDTRLFVKSS